MKTDDEFVEIVGASNPTSTARSETGFVQDGSSMCLDKSPRRCTPFKTRDQLSGFGDGSPGGRTTAVPDRSWFKATRHLS